MAEVKSIRDNPVFRGVDNNWYDLFEGPLIDLNGDEFIQESKSLSDTDFYQGLNMVHVIRRVEDSRLFGLFYWDDISKYGSTYVESNGDEYGFAYDEEDTDTEGISVLTEYYVYEPVEPFEIVGYKAVSNG